MKNSKQIFSLQIVIIAILYLLPSSSFADGLIFIENKGQFANQAHYKVKLNNGAIFFENNTWTLNFTERSHSHNHEHENVNSEEHDHNEHSEKAKAHAYKMNFIGANPRPVLKADKVLPHYQNYFKGNDPSKWASNVSLYKELVYDDLYEGIDMKIYENDGKFKYDFIVEANQNPSKIKIGYEGIESIAIRSEGLVIKTSVNEVTELHPYAYQIIEGERREVACEFVLKNNEVQFEFPDGWNVDYNLIIDPTLIFSSFSGSITDNWAYTATYDNDRNLYSGSIIFSAGYPTTTGSYNLEFTGGDCDIAISKFNPYGTDLIYSTFIGGLDTEIPQSLIVNNKNQLVIFGTTGSNNYPTTSQAFDKDFNVGPKVVISGEQLNFSNGVDIILTILNTDGNALVGSTLFGGDGIDGLNYTITDGVTDSILTGLFINYGDHARGEVIVDKDDNIFIASTTFSCGINGVNNLQENCGGKADGLVAKFNSDVSDLKWFTYLGGARNDAAYSLRINNQTNEIYVCGGTQSSNFPNTNGLNNNYGGGPADGFVTRISSNGDAFLNSTYIGTSNYDQAMLIDLDTTGNVYLFGQTTGEFTISPNTYSNWGSSQFIQKLNSDLSVSMFSAVFGDGQPKINISPTAFTISEDERIYLSGWGGEVNQSMETGFTGDTNNMPITPDAYKSNTDGSDLYFAVFEKNAKQLLYATYFGNSTLDDNSDAGEHVDGGTSRIDKNGFLYQAVCAGCYGRSDFPTTAGAWSNENNASNACNLAVVKFYLKPSSPQLHVEEPFILNSEKEPFFKIFPNPNNGQFVIESADNEIFTNVEIHNNIGQLIQETSVTNAQSTIDLRALGSGVYFIKIENRNGDVWVEKIVVE